MDEQTPADERAIIPAFVRGEAAAVTVVDGWIETVLRAEFQSIQGDWDDLKQEIRLRVLTCLRAGRFNGDSTLRTYVHRIARYTGIDSTRKAYRRRETGEAPGGAEPRSSAATDPASRLAERDHLTRLLQGLSVRDRAIVDLVFAQHLSHAEVAGRLGLSEGAVRSQVFRVRERLVRRSRILLRLPEGTA